MIHMPLLEIHPLDLLPQSELSLYDAFIFTSKSAVLTFFKRHRLYPNQKIFAIGSATAAVLKSFGVNAHYISQFPDSISLDTLIRSMPYKKLLYPCSNLSANIIHTNPGVEPYPLYEVRDKKQEQISLANFDGVFFSSASTVDAFSRLYKIFPEQLLYYVMGTATMRKLLQYHVNKEQIINVQEISSSPR